MRKRMNAHMLASLALALSLVLTACGGPSNAPEEETAPEPIRVAALKGPTGMGLAGLEEAYGADSGELTLTLAGSADEITPALIRGSWMRPASRPTWPRCCTTRPAERS